MKEPPTYCEDWSCPARVSCARHFGRSADYAKMAERQRFRLKKFDRGDADSCADYRFDRPRSWLMPQPGQITHIPPGYW